MSRHPKSLDAAPPPPEPKPVAAGTGTEDDRQLDQWLAGGSLLELARQIIILRDHEDELQPSGIEVMATLPRRLMTRLESLGKNNDADELARLIALGERLFTAPLFGGPAVKLRLPSAPVATPDDVEYPVHPAPRPP